MYVWELWRDWCVENNNIVVLRYRITWPWEIYRNIKETYGLAQLTESFPGTFHTLPIFQVNFSIMKNGSKTIVYTHKCKILNYIPLGNTYTWFLMVFTWLLLFIPTVKYFCEFFLVFSPLNLVFKGFSLIFTLLSPWLSLDLFGRKSELAFWKMQWLPLRQAGKCVRISYLVKAYGSLKFQSLVIYF